MSCVLSGSFAFASALLIVAQVTNKASDLRRTRTSNAFKDLEGRA